MDANLASRVATDLHVVLKENKGRDHSHSELARNPLGILLGVNRDPLLNLVRKLLLHIIEGGLDDLARSAGRRPEMKNNNTAHSIFSTVT